MVKIIDDDHLVMMIDVPGRFASPNIFHSSDYDFENVSGDSSTARWIICMSGRKSPLME